jgi:signal peptidase I
MTDELRDSLDVSGTDAQNATADPEPSVTEPLPESPHQAAQAEESSGGTIRWLLETVAMVIIAFLLAQGIKTFVLQPFVVPTGSMETTIMTGDRVLSEKVSLYWSEPQAGDIVVFDDPQARHPQLIKRVVAVSGQTVDIQDGIVLVDGEPLDESYLDPGITTDPGSVALPITVGENELWLMGDNRPNSGDSRFLGPQPLEAINAKAFAIYWPFDRIGMLE